VPLDSPKRRLIGLVSAQNWGETRGSRVGYASFRRAESTHPLATAAIYYNDAAGIRAIAGAVTAQRH